MNSDKHEHSGHEYMVVDSVHSNLDGCIVYECKCGFRQFFSPTGEEPHLSFTAGSRHGTPVPEPLGVCARGALPGLPDACDRSARNPARASGSLLERSDARPQL